MNLRFYVICTAALLASGISVLPVLGVPFLTDSSHTATVHGVTYAWDTLEPINDTVVEVNSTPPQSIVAKDGVYSFELASGDYAITARYYQNNSLTYSKETTFKVEDEGNYVLDLLLYPVLENAVVGTIAVETNIPNGEDPPGKSQTGTAANYAPIAVTLFLLLGGSYKLSRRHRKTNKNRLKEERFDISGFMVKILSKIAGSGTGSGTKPEFGHGGAVSIKESVIGPADNSKVETSEIKVVDKKKLPLPPDLHEVLDIIRGHKGKITQKDLRSRLGYSEVKVSLMLSELENRGLIKKFRNGRENIVILTDED